MRSAALYSSNIVLEHPPLALGLCFDNYDCDTHSFTRARPATCQPDLRTTSSRHLHRWQIYTPVDDLRRASIAST
ncbi:hypothetical protein BCV70DRAFT_50536 [Testicularia cyperi]|uniref:Uncharacterized protein n=1 Tax=Testicularia cyperi TaxID=1882483 RepID=A0A317XGN3_9BASI|nr:hypothetical protein BCV70DRAFT_50536 [Testicularia cyperi]